MSLGTTISLAAIGIEIVLAVCLHALNEIKSAIDRNTEAIREGKERL